MRLLNMTMPQRVGWTAVMGSLFVGVLIVVVGPQGLIALGPLVFLCVEEVLYGDRRRGEERDG